MNAREALQLIGDLRLDQLTIGELAAINDAGLRALRLLAAAEANDGTAPETDAAEIKIQSGFKEVPTGTAPADFARRIERERNGLAARVAELEPDAGALQNFCSLIPLPPAAITYDQGRIIVDAAQEVAVDFAARSKP